MADKKRLSDHQTLKMPYLAIFFQKKLTAGSTFYRWIMSSGEAIQIVSSKHC